MDTTDTNLQEASPISLLHSAVEDETIFGTVCEEQQGTVCGAPYSGAQCVGHNTLQGQPAVTEQSNWDGTTEKYTAVQ